MKNPIFVGRNMFFSTSRTSVFVRGIIAALLGVCFIINPDRTFFALTYIVGVMMVVSAVFGLISAGNIASPVLRGSAYTVSAALLLLGLFMMIFPGCAAFIVMIVVAFLSLAGGIRQLAMIRGGRSGSGYIVLSGVLSILFGILIIAMPFSAMAAIGLFVGIYLLAFGVFTITLAISSGQKN